MKPERIVLESSLAGMGLEATGQPRLSSRNMQRTAVDDFLHAYDSSELGGIFFIQAVIGMKLEDTISQMTARWDSVTFMGWQEEVAKLSSKQHKQFDPGG